MKAGRLTLVVVAVLVLPAAAPADVGLDSIVGVTIIDDGAGAHRVLFKTQGLAGLSGVAVRRAGLILPCGGPSDSRTLRLEVCPVTTAWSAGSVDWNAGWQTPGGDFDREMASLAEIDLSSGATQVSFDVTPIVKELVESGAFFDGFLLTTPARDGGGISLADIGRFQGLTGASLSVTYRHVPPPPQRAGRARAAREGSVAEDPR